MPRGGGGGKGPKPPKITDQAFATAENPIDGSTIGFVEADVKPDRSLWSILAGNDDGAYAIDPLTGELFVADVLQLFFILISIYLMILLLKLFLMQDVMFGL